MTVLLHVVFTEFSVACYGVFDGHGGSECAQAASVAFPKELFNCKEFFDGDYDYYIREVFARTDKV